jgi:hypothetical protein
MLIAIARYQDTVSGAWELSQSISLHRLDFQAGVVTEEARHPFPGVPAAPQWLKEQGASAMLVGTIDPDNADVIADQSIHVFTGADGASPEEIAHHFLKLMRGAMNRGPGGGCCGGHGGEEDAAGCCGGHEHEHGEEEGGCCGGGGGENCCGGTGHDDPDHECQCK